ncbi:MucR family transcriptional regulator [Aquamicrobium sp. LC103]|uniref:MucR family transcriptional regulator n=1 Tax=Aquamicrobium sp. LC103 TaxID=1120658 RepID=UPI00063E7729|nr:MucR family transcriptional regulator [Aquamicrobium sp. LC103]TKT79979.1 MucR family transcriptional regulator [Aquamicrobium sp. LC103]
METDPDRAEVNSQIELTADIVSAYVSNNPVPAAELPALIESIHGTLRALAGAAPAGDSEPFQKPAVPIKKSVHDDYIICLEDGKKFKSLKRHLTTYYGMTPDDYRAKWGLPRDYPMVAPGYAAVRSEMAKKMGLGRKKAAEPEPKKRGRKKAA